MNYKKINFILIILSSILLADSSLSGNINFYSAFRTSNSSLIRLPYRLTNLNFQQQKNDIQLNSSMSVEHHIRKDVETLDDNSPQDFLIDLREIYLSYYTNFGEFRFGKQIHSWGMVDENSPMDNINAYDYYYLFLGGSEKKIGSFSGLFEFYFNDWKFATLFSPIHHTNRIPINDSNFPIELTVIPKGKQIMTTDNNKFEYGGYIQRSFSNSEFRFSYFNGYDRLFNFSGLNIFVQDLPYPPGPPNPTDLSFPNVDIVYGYRKTNMKGFGSTLFIGDIALRSDFAIFDTKDINNDVKRENPNAQDIENQYYTELGATSINVDFDDEGNEIFRDTTFATFPINEKAKYIQYTLQLEYELPYKVSTVVQFSAYELKEYSFTDHTFPENIDIPNFDGKTLPELDPKALFNPGMGTSISTLSPKILILSFEKLFFDDRMKINILDIYDINNPNFNFSSEIIGLFEVRCEYRLTDGLTLLGSINKVTGDDNHQDGDLYPFNQMKDFSHYRLELKYYF